MIVEEQINDNQRPQAHSPSVGSTLSTSDWSSTAPHSFSDGVWLEDRSEGERGRFSLDPQQARLISAKLGPLPIDSSAQFESEEADSLTLADQKVRFYFFCLLMFFVS